jgi:hypothetical protein
MESWQCKTMSTVVAIPPKTLREGQLIVYGNNLKADD